MLKSIMLIISSIILCSTAVAQECSFVKNETMCAHPKIKLLDNMLESKHLSLDSKIDVEYMLTHICFDDAACVHDTLIHQHKNKDLVSKTYVVIKPSGMDCVRVRIATPENSTVLVEKDGVRAMGILNEEMLKTATSTYIKENKSVLPANTCSRPEKSVVYLQVN